MTGFEYTAAIGMLFENQTEKGLQCIRNIRSRYDGRKRSPFNEAECGHHYARAMASWASVLALSGFHYSEVEKSMRFAAKEGRFFWSNGYSWGSCSLEKNQDKYVVQLSVKQGEIGLKKFILHEFGEIEAESAEEFKIKTGETKQFDVNRMSGAKKQV
jgi:hypothetical protein